MLKQKQAQSRTNPKLASNSQPELKHIFLQMFLSFSYRVNKITLVVSATGSVESFYNDHINRV